jgi:hypothetical protein
MAQFNNLSITNKGRNLYAKAQAGTQLHFTKMQIGSGLIGTQNPETLLALIDPQYDVGIQSITPNTEAKTATISGMINNDNVIDATYICEIGLFAQDPDDGEILYAYGSAGSYGDYFAPATSGAYSWNYQIIAAVGNAANVTVELSNLTYDYGAINTNTTLLYITGGNQKEINKSIDNLFRTYTTSNNGNIYTINASSITSSNLIDGFPLCLKINADSTGTTSIKINSLTAILLKKANGQAITNLKANGIYTFRYNATTGNFILQGEGGGGTATPDKILAPYTATTDAGDITGTIPSKGAQTYTPGTTNQVISALQYLSGNQTILGDSELISSNILSTANIFGVQGSATIQSLGGMQVKSGTVTYHNSDSTTFNTVNQSGIQTITSAYITVSDLPFTPSIIIMYTSSPSLGYYSSQLTGNQYYETALGSYSLDHDSQWTDIYVLNNSNIYYGGFKLPVINGQQFWNYIAFGN